MKADQDTRTYTSPSRYELAGRSWREIAQDHLRELLGKRTLEDQYMETQALPAAAQQAAERATREAAAKSNQATEDAMQYGGPEKK